MKRVWGTQLIAVCFLLAGCASALDTSQKADRTQSPAADARWLTLAVTLPEGARPLPVKLHYDSARCKEPRSYGVGGQSQSGVAMMRASHYEDLELVKDPAGHQYKGHLAIDGGGPCQWMLTSLETAFTYTSRHPLVKGREVKANRISFEFAKAKDAIRAPNVRMVFPYVAVIITDDDASEKELRLAPLGFINPPTFDPSASGTMYLVFKVHDDNPITARPVPQDRYRYLVSYPDGSTSVSHSKNYVGVQDARIRCLIMPVEGDEKKKDCSNVRPDATD